MPSPQKTTFYLLVILLFAVAPDAAIAQADNEIRFPKSIGAVPVPNGPSVDGILNDAAWETASWVTDFVQLEPVEGGQPSGRTEVAFVFTDDALFVGARMFSDDPAAVNALVTRRDVESNAEQLAVSLDTYLNRRTAYTFAVTAGGARIDYFHDGDSQFSRDYSFDPVWSASTRQTPDGWTAEFRIPFSQLRFNEVAEQTWGVNINRRIPSVDEDVYWILIPRNDAGWVSRFGALTGIRDIRATRRLEITPYMAGGAVATGDPDPNNPFASSRDASGTIGVDAKVGLGSNLTLDVTVNPDFGQVEADPAEVNLTAFESFFDERRPFFAEGSDLLSGSLFYSRRIGVRPRGSATGDYVDRPSSTTILGAGKISGRTGGGLSIAALAAATEAEYARTFDTDTGVFSRAKVEPLASYAAFAASQEFGTEGSTFGIRATAVNRALGDDPAVQRSFNRAAYAGEVNWNVRFDGGAYVIDGGFGVTSVSGTASRIARLQRSSVHYFQRPDADYVSFDDSRTSMSGFNGDLYFGKNAGSWTGGTYLGIESPGLDPNDLGRLGRADEVVSFTEISYRETEPGRLFHRYQAGLTTVTSWNFGGRRNSFGVDGQLRLTWRNFWQTTLFVGFNPTGASDTATRGGPRVAVAGERNIAVEASTNRSKKFSASVYAYRETDDLERLDHRFQASLAWQPSARVDLSVSPGFLRLQRNRQYVTTLPDGPAATFDSRYVFALIDRTQVSARFRMNYTLTPDFTLELYAEPFAASGAYHRYGEIQEPGGLDLREYGEDPGSSITPDESGYTVQVDGESFRLPRPDFNVTSFRTNTVLRWEWRPGSTLFLVWQQDRSGFSPTGDSVTPGALGDALSATGDNFFRVKLTYWLPVD